MGFAAFRTRMPALQQGDLELSARVLAQEERFFGEPGHGDPCLVFVNYRASDVGVGAERIAVALAGHFGPGAIFLDRQDIALGQVFTVRIDLALQTARGLPILPVLVGLGALPALPALPALDDLPASLGVLGRETPAVVSPAAGAEEVAGLAARVAGLLGDRP